MREVILNSFATIDHPEMIKLSITKEYGIKNSYPVEFVEVNVPLSSPSGKSEVWILIYVIF
jgi:hypothetical protein